MKDSHDFDIALYLYSYLLNYYIRRNSVLMSRNTYYVFFCKNGVSLYRA
jgi:hypothetical protein